MDKHYFKPTDKDLSDMMERYTNWLADRLESEGNKSNIDQSVDKIGNI